MNKRGKLYALGTAALVWSMLAPGPEALAAVPAIPNLSYCQIDLMSFEKPKPLSVSISREESIARHWRPGQRLRIIAFVERRDGRKEYLKDVNGKSAWDVVLNPHLRTSLNIVPSRDTFSGRLVLKANGMPLTGPDSLNPKAASFVIEKYYEYRFDDGAKIRVYYTDQMLDASGEASGFAKEVFDAAVMAYQTITQFEGFNTRGYAFASADPRYAYDPDKTIDVYLGNPDDDIAFSHHGFGGASFKDAPCFDTVRVSETAFNAVILLPSNYREFIRNWERLNPSPLGTRNVGVDLRGTLIHEMLHVIVFYYNKNLNKDLNGRAKHLDWYVEGLARYFETFAGARHDFFSKGFKQALPDKIRFSRGGSNYFMAYPDQAFTDLRYENALFWRFIDFKFGMAVIEKLSRDLRGYEREDFSAALETATRTPFSELLKQFALSILFKDFGLKDENVYLADVARTRLVYRKEELYLKDGFGAEKELGPVCRTDWIGEWDGRRAKLGEAPAAGDNTDLSDVSGWATDFYEIELDASEPSLPNLAVIHQGGGGPLETQVIIRSKGGSVLIRSIPAISQNRAEASLDLNREVAREGLEAAAIDRIFVLVTNMDPKNPSEYAIQASAPGK